MPKTKIETYSIQVKERRSRTDDYYALDDIEGEHFLTYFENYLASLVASSTVSEATKSILTFEPNSKVISRNGWHIAGRVRLGEFGVANPIHDVDTFEEKYLKTDRDAELFPLYFLACGTPGRNRGVLVLQRFGHVGVSSHIRKSFARYIADTTPEVHFEVLPLIPRELLAAMINDGEISQVLLRSNRLPDNAVDKLMAKGFTQNVTKLDVVLKGDGGGSVFQKDLLRSWLRNPDPTFFTIDEMRDYGLDGHHHVLVKVAINGSVREIDFSDTMKIRPYIDINDDIVNDPDGHPEFDSIHQVTLDFARRLLHDQVDI